MLKKYRLVTGFLLLFILAGFTCVWAFSADELEAKYANGLDYIIESVPSDSVIQVMVRFIDPIPSGVLWKEVAGMRLPERKKHVKQRLEEQLYNAAGDVINWIEKQYYAGHAEKLHPLWINHGYLLRIETGLVPQLAEFDEVITIIYDPPIPIEDVIDAAPDKTGVSDNDPQPLSRWNVGMVGAHPLWHQGYTGRGALVAVIDTGVLISHPDLEANIWENEAEVNGFPGVDDDENGYIDDYNGWNFWDDDNDVDDIHGHGTKCAGIICGNGTNRADTTGVAPDATLMVIRNFVQGTVLEMSWDAAFQYAVDNGAEITSCSMSYVHGTWLPQFGRYDNHPDERNVTHRTTLENGLLMGVIHANSQGNMGTTYGVPYNIHSPGDCPPPWLHDDQELVGGTSACMSTGANDIDGDLYTYTGRGPVEWIIEDNPEEYRDYPYEGGDSMGLLKPDIVAPGSAYTTADDGDYDYHNGESCATPHAAGVYTLLKSIHPQAAPEAIAEAVKMTAYNPAGAGVHDNDFGAGMIRADSAHAYLDEMFEYGGLQVNVTDDEQQPLNNARIELNDNEVRGFTDESGELLLERILSGTYTVTAMAEGFEAVTVEDVQIAVGEIQEINIIMAQGDFYIMPDNILRALDPEDTLDVEFTFGNMLETPMNVNIQLKPTLMDWEPENQVVLQDIIGFFSPEGVVILEDEIVVAGENLENDLLVWRFSLEGELIESFPQPERFEDGVQDLASTNDGFIFAGHENKIFKLNSSWEIVDSLTAPVAHMRGLAYDDENERFFINGTATDLFEINLEGAVQNSWDLDITPVGLAYNPDDIDGPAVYDLEMGGAGNAVLRRLDLASGEFQTLADLALEGPDFACALDLDKFHAKPYLQVVTLQLDSGVRFFEREIRSDAYYLPEMVTVDPGETNVDFSLYGPMFTYGRIFNMDLVWTEENNNWSVTVPVSLDIVGVEDEGLAAIPNSADILTSWPNPFNPITRIKYLLGEKKEITIAVYNLLGQRITLLDSGVKVAGEHTVTWDASLVSSGIYLAVLETESKSYIQKLLLIK